MVDVLTGDAIFQARQGACSRSKLHQTDTDKKKRHAKITLASRRGREPRHVRVLWTPASSDRPTVMADDLHLF